MNNLMGKASSKDFRIILQHLMLDPLSYIHPQRLHLSAHLSYPLQHAVINDILLTHYVLHIEAVDSIALESQAQLLIHHWRQLPQIVFLLACQRLRADLARSGTLLKLPSWARQFASISLRASMAQKSPTHLSIAKLLAVGLAELLSWKLYLPIWLQQRLLLLFSTESEMIAQNMQLNHISSVAPDINLFILAAQHAKNNYDPSFTAAA